MRNYLQVTYYTLSGVKQLIDLGNNSYGEWIIYNNKVPTYHVNVFDSNVQSNFIIAGLLDEKKETIDSVVSKINLQYATRLSLGNIPLFKIVKQLKLITLKLPPLPEAWVKNI